MAYPRTRERDCRHCGGPHMDFYCPSRPPAERRPVRAYMLETDNLEGEHMEDFGYGTDYSAPEERQSEPNLVKDRKETQSGNKQRHRMRVDAANDK